MLKYTIKAERPLSHYLNIQLEFEVSQNQELDLILPLWRPGRYEAADYVRNIRNVRIKSTINENLQLHKVSKNVWRVKVSPGTILINYEYFAYQLDAGGSYLNDDLCLINFINCLLYPAGQENETCEVNLKLPDLFTIACTLKFKDDKFYASNYDELVDKPLLASKQLESYHYTINNLPFTVWVAGKAPLDINDLVPDFKSFSEAQLKTFNSIPFDKYFFLIVSLPYRFYHGVEHSDNTVIVLGVDDPEHERQKYIDDLIGVSSHELFHAWNIKKIRPKEMLPYNFREPILFNTGLVAEGFTTYYGDLFLTRGGVWSVERYLGEMNVFFKRHYRNTGRFVSSLIDSSNNLWIDGYKPGPPNHKVSIYVKGAIIAFILDLKIRISSDHKKSLDDLMRQLDKDYIEKGYSIDDIKAIAEELCNEDLNEIFQKYIYGIDPVDEQIKGLVEEFGLEFIRKDPDNILEKNFGLLTELREDYLSIENIFPGSEAESKLSIGDKILFINDVKPTEITDSLLNSHSLQFSIKRLDQEKEIEVNSSGDPFFYYYELTLLESSTKEQLEARDKWLK